MKRRTEMFVLNGSVGGFALAIVLAAVFSWWPPAAGDGTRTPNSRLAAAAAASTPSYSPAAPATVETGRPVRPGHRHNTSHHHDHDRNPEHERPHVVADHDHTAPFLASPTAARGADTAALRRLAGPAKRPSGPDFGFERPPRA